MRLIDARSRDRLVSLHGQGDFIGCMDLDATNHDPDANVNIGCNYGPDQPQGLTAVPDDGLVDLSWESSPEEDIGSLDSRATAARLATADS